MNIRDQKGYQKTFQQKALITADPRVVEEEEAHLTVPVQQCNSEINNTINEETLYTNKTNQNFMFNLNI